MGMQPIGKCASQAAFLRKFQGGMAVALPAAVSSLAVPTRSAT